MEIDEYDDEALRAILRMPGMDPFSSKHDPLEQGDLQLLLTEYGHDWPSQSDEAWLRSAERALANVQSPFFKSLGAIDIVVALRTQKELIELSRA